MSMNAVVDLQSTCRPAAIRFARLYRFPIEDADDVLQDVAISFLAKAPTIREPKSWFVGAVKKKFANKARVRGVRERLDIGLVGYDPTQRHQFVEQEGVEIVLDLRRTLSKLDVRSRKLVVMRAFGYVDEEISQCTGYAAGSVRKVAQRCREKMGPRAGT